MHLIFVGEVIHNLGSFTQDMHDCNANDSHYHCTSNRHSYNQRLFLLGALILVVAIVDIVYRCDNSLHSTDGGHRRSEDTTIDVAIEKIIDFSE